MKSYTITVNGTAYEVTVEETGRHPLLQQLKAAPKAAPAVAQSSSSCSRRRRSESNCFRTW